MNNMDKKVLIYCRVSTQQQTTDRQKEELLKFVEDNHWNVEEEDIFIDVISGFKKGEFRPEYAKMLERVEYGDIDIILFSEFSRLARNATELLEQIKLFIDKGINLYFDKQKLWVRDSNKDVGSLILLHVLLNSSKTVSRVFNGNTPFFTLLAVLSNSRHDDIVNSVGALYLSGEKSNNASFNLWAKKSNPSRSLV